MSKSFKTKWDSLLPCPPPHYQNLCLPVMILVFDFLIFSFFHNQMHLASGPPPTCLDCNKKWWFGEGTGRDQQGSWAACYAPFPARSAPTEPDTTTCWNWVNLTSELAALGESQSPEGVWPGDRRAREANKAAGWETQRTEPAEDTSEQNSGANEI